jgi:hypothetical protein
VKEWRRNSSFCMWYKWFSIEWKHDSWVRGRERHVRGREDGGSLNFLSSNKSQMN